MRSLPPQPGWRPPARRATPSGYAARHLDEQAFRYNNRKGFEDEGRFDLAVRPIAGKRLAFDQLTGKTAEGQA
jgi:hypothetical protein